MLKTNHLLLILLTTFSFNNNAKELAISFDDSPRFARGYFDGQTRANKLIETLKKHNVEQVAFFSVSKNLDSEGINRLKLYANAGHIIANHTNSHPNFNQLDLIDYQQDFIKADKHLRQFKTYKKLFRFPYLREGNTVEKRDGMRTTLEQLGYINAYITLNNYDWYIENLFQKAIKDNAKLNFDKLRKFYVDVLVQSIEYYDDMAEKHLGRSPKHMLLLHEMDITALFIGDLVDELRSRGWKIISPEQAYTDEIAHYKTDRILKHNPGRIGEIARDKGQTKGLWHESCDENYLDIRFAKEVL
ncbi:MAG: polysaccharide deacetylase family protein [Colwellia sp.]|nr:polysaccharide deacetylase family protein [Colwellia sp.]